jgi:hypothetical protein
MCVQLLGVSFFSARTLLTPHDHCCATYFLCSVLAKTCHKKQSDAEVKQNDAFVVGQTPFLGHLREKYGMDVTYNPCRSDYSAPFLNQPAVQKAIHVLKRNDGTSKVREWPGRFNHF